MRLLGSPGHRPWKAYRRSLLAGVLVAWVAGVGGTYLYSHREAGRLSSGARALVAATQTRLIQVGGLPVTCNLTLPIACAAMEKNAMDHAAMGMSGEAHAAMTSDTVTAGLVEYQKYSGFPEMKEAMMSGRLQAGYLLAPMVMDLADSGIPVKIVALGHRSGAVLMVHQESQARNFGDLRGARIAIPSRFAVDHLFVRRLMEEYGVGPDEIELIEMPPPDMPSALFSRAVDAYATGEPWGATAELDGYARPLHMTRDIWPDYICCVLAVRQELIDGDPATVQRLVNHILSAGEWLESDVKNRDTAARLASGMRFFGQSPKVLQYALRNPTDRVTYGELQALRTDLDALMQLSVQYGLLQRPVAYEQYVDDSFFRNFEPVEIKLDE